MISGRVVLLLGVVLGVGIVKQPLFVCGVRGSDNEAYLRAEVKQIVREWDSSGDSPIKFTDVVEKGYEPLTGSEETLRLMFSTAYMNMESELFTPAKQLIEESEDVQKRCTDKMLSPAVSEKRESLVATMEQTDADSISISYRLTTKDAIEILIKEILFLYIPVRKEMKSLNVATDRLKHGGKCTSVEENDEDVKENAAESSFEYDSSYESPFNSPFAAPFTGSYSSRFNGTKKEMKKKKPSKIPIYRHRKKVNEKKENEEGEKEAEGDAAESSFESPFDSPYGLSLAGQRPNPFEDIMKQNSSIQKKKKKKKHRARNTQTSNKRRNVAQQQRKLRYNNK